MRVDTPPPRPPFPPFPPQCKKNQLPCVKKPCVKKQAQAMVGSPLRKNTFFQSLPKRRTPTRPICPKLNSKKHKKSLLPLDLLVAEEEREPRRLAVALGAREERAAAERRRLYDGDSRHILYALLGRGRNKLPPKTNSRQKQMRKKKSAAPPYHGDSRHGTGGGGSKVGVVCEMGVVCNQ